MFVSVDIWPYEMFKNSFFPFLSKIYLNPNIVSSIFLLVSKKTQHPKKSFFSNDVKKSPISFRHHSDLIFKKSFLLKKHSKNTQKIVSPRNFKRHVFVQYYFLFCGKVPHWSVKRNMRKGFNYL